MRINLHSGHNPDGKKGCGAVGIIKESTENRIVTAEIIRQLRGLKHEVFDCTVNNGVNAKDVLNKIIKKCNANEVDLDISIHFNSGVNDYQGNHKTTGTEVYIYSKNSKAKEYAEKVVAEISALGYKNRGVKVNAQFYILKKSKAPAMLIECCFVDDKDDVEIYDYQTMSNAIVKAITGQLYQEEQLEVVSDETIGEGEETPTGNPDQLYRVQVGAYAVKENAERMHERLKELKIEAFIVKA